MRKEIEKLSETELAVLRMVVGEMTDNEIAFALDISDKSIKNYLESLNKKLGVSSRKSVAKIAIEAGLIRINL